MTRIGILVVAYNAATTLTQVLDRIPASFRPRITEVLVGDDHSQDETFAVGMEYQQRVTDLPIKVVRHPKNLGYGGNQKAGYHWAIDTGLDVIVLLHGDGQYAPELLPDMVAPLERGEADAVFGSRMIDRGAARRGGMPLYKLIGNRILTRFENAVVGLDLSEWHSGYRAYSVDALRSIPFDRNSDGFDFDSQVIIQLKEAGRHITEIPIPTFYGDEICYVNGLGYARDITREALRYRLHKMGFGSGETAFASNPRELKPTEGTSPARLLDWIGGRSPGRVLDLGCGDGTLGGELRAAGHEVTGVDIEKLDPVTDRLDRFIAADLDQGMPPEVGTGYDVVLAADVIEHVRQPERLLREARDVLAPGGTVVASVPNFSHWYPRLRVAAGRFDYDQRGILDTGHVRFFTARSFERTAARAGFEVVRRDTTGLPLDVADRGSDSSEVASGRLGRLIARVDRRAAQRWPRLFAYQLLYELSPSALSTGGGSVR
jgi:glycosyltransferase involved in cell wall biosynthesis/cyclopropane fatty-acyl-phospholipid synthase-like methyltransferase